MSEVSKMLVQRWKAQLIKERLDYEKRWSQVPDDAVIRVRALGKPISIRSK